MRNALFTLAALVAAGMVFLGTSGGVTAQGTPPPAPSPVSGESHPAHIHNGTCASLGDVVAPLSNVSTESMNNGTPMATNTMVGSTNAIPVLSSVTTVDMAFADVLAGEHAINVHESAENIGNYVACGDIGGTMIGQTDILFGIAPLNNSGLSGVGSLHDNGDGTTTVYVYLTKDIMAMGAGGGIATPMPSPSS